MEVTHSHYQKLLEQVAGPSWSRDMGPMERDEGGGGGEGIETAASSTKGTKDTKGGPGAVADGTMSTGRLPAAGGAGKGSSAQADSVSVRGKVLKTNSHHKLINSTSRFIYAEMPSTQADSRIRKLETQLDIQKTKLDQAESRLAAKRIEAEEFRERMMAKDFTQVAEMKRLRQELQSSKERLADGQAMIKHKVSRTRILQLNNITYGSSQLIGASEN